MEYRYTLWCRNVVNTQNSKQIGGKLILLKHSAGEKHRKFSIQHLCIYALGRMKLQTHSQREREKIKADKTYNEIEFIWMTTIMKGKIEGKPEELDR